MGDVLSDVYANRRRFLNQVEDDISVKHEIVKIYDPVILTNCYLLLSNYYGFGHDKEDSIVDVMCFSLSKFQWRWYLFVLNNKSTILEKYYFDCIFNPEAMAVLNYTREKYCESEGASRIISKKSEFLRPHEFNSTPEEVLERLKIKTVPLFNTQHCPEITGSKIYYCLPRTNEMCDKIRENLINFTRIYELKDGDKVLYSKMYVVPFCELCFSNTSLVQVNGPGYTMCIHCFDKEVKSRERVSVIYY